MLSNKASLPSTSVMIMISSRSLYKFVLTAPVRDAAGVCRTRGLRNKEYLQKRSYKKNKMGYRHYFYKVKKADVEAIKDMDMTALYDYAKGCNAEVYEEERSFYFNDSNFLHKTEGHEFGKLYWDDTAERIYSKGVPLFAKKEVQDEFSDYVPYVVGKEGVLEAIAIYQEKVINYYKGLLKDGIDYCLPLSLTIHKDDVESIDKLIAHIENKLQKILYLGLADTNEKNKWQVTSSWEYEHSIFNLVHILKSIDWEQDTILFYGW